MNPLKMLLLVIVSAALACSAFASEGQADTPAAAAGTLAEADDAPGAAMLAAAVLVTELDAPAAARYRLAGAAAVQYAAADGSRISARAAATTGGGTAPGTGLPSMPEPADWMQLLCGLVVAGFIARRRTGLVAD
ncbi:MAG TPA: hypothetical protein VKD25_09325 [Burkholderiales bacterium]|nr:hypothetical protein [Burkholderiales bacterium]